MKVHIFRGDRWNGNTAGTTCTEVKGEPFRTVAKPPLPKIGPILYTSLMITPLRHFELTSRITSSVARLASVGCAETAFLAAFWTSALTCIVHNTVYWLLIISTVNPGYNEPFCTVENGSLYPGIRCKGHAFTWIRQGGAHHEGSLYQGVRCTGRGG